MGWVIKFLGGKQGLSLGFNGGSVGNPLFHRMEVGDKPAGGKPMPRQAAGRRTITALPRRLQRPTVQAADGTAGGPQVGMKTEQKYFEWTVFVFYIMNRFLIWKIVSFNWFHNHFQSFFILFNC
jgi:hypothetical protein